MAELFEVLIVDGEHRWHAGWLSTDDADRLLHDGDGVPVFSARAGLEHLAQERGHDLLDDLPDEVDLDLGGWLSGTGPQPTTAEVSELWHLLHEDPVASGRLGSAALEDAYDDLTDDEPDWFAVHGETARAALAESVRLLRAALRPAGRP